MDLWRRDTGAECLVLPFPYRPTTVLSLGASPAWDSRGAFGLEEEQLLSGSMLLVSVP